MRTILSEYALVMIATIGGTFLFVLYSLLYNGYKEFSKNFIGCITGSYMEYESEITLEDIENGEIY